MILARRLLLALTALSLPSSVLAQDTRAVREPTIPPACVTLTARLAPVGDSTLAEADEGKLDTDRIQRALDQCPKGQAVRLAAEGTRRAFLVGPLRLAGGVALWVDWGAIVFASRDPALYDLPGTPGRCGTVDAQGHGCKPILTAVDASGAAVLGEGVIDGRGGAHLLGKDISWWDLAEQARSGGNQNVPRLMHLIRADDFTLYGITLRNSPNFHVLYSDGNGLTAWGVKIWSPANARNADGIDPQNATNVTITRSFIHAGDDNVAIKGSQSAARNITVSHNHFYAGHGMSIGSETNGGVEHIRVTDLSIDGADNGLRIKSNETRGGKVRDVLYEDVCIRETKNPVYMDTHYAFRKETRGLFPDFRDVTLRNVRIQGKGKLVLDGYSADRRLGITFDGVTLDDPAAIRITASHADVTLGPGPVNFLPAGDDVHVTGTPAAASAAPANACQGKFVPFPAPDRE